MLRNTARFVAPLFLLAQPALPAVIRGTVVERQSGRALARAAVTLQPVAGTPATERSVRTNSTGQFEFSDVPAGSYVLKAARRGFLTTEYGQKQWNSAGVPLRVSTDDAPFLNIRLARYSGITGIVVDENDVGLPEMEVLAYRATQPPTLVARAKSDDRGAYRISGLTPGFYLVRSAGGRGELADYLPTFGRETLRVDESRQVQVLLDDDSRNADIRPLPGSLFTLRGDVVPVERPIGAITVTLASDTGRTVSRGPQFQFPGLPPGPYELYAEAAADASSGARMQSGFVRLNLGGDSDVKVSIFPNVTHFEVTPAPATPVRVMARRVDLAGAGPAAPLKLNNNRISLALGRWELMLEPAAGQYVSQVSGARGLRPDAWNEVEIRQHSLVRFSLASGAGQIHGVVRNGSETVSGAPVYLEAYDPATRRRVLDLRSVRTDMQGRFQFDKIAPGVYRLIATFEFQNPDAATMDTAATELRLDVNAGAAVELSLYKLR